MIYVLYFRFSQPKQLTVYQYRIDFEPDIESARTRRFLVNQLRQHFKDSLIFDGMYDLVSVNRLPKQVNEFHQQLQDGTQYKVIVKFTAEVNWAQNPEVMMNIMRFYNTLLRKFYREYLKWIQIGRLYFNPKNNINVSEYNVSLWSGMVTAIAIHDGGSMIVCNPAVKCVRSDTVYELMRRIKDDSRRGRNLIEEIKNEIVGMIVLTRYNNRTYQIADVDFQNNPQSYRFDCKGQNINLMEYYQQTWNHQIKDAKQPLLIGELSLREKRMDPNKKFPILVPELCLLTGLTPSMTNDRRLMRTLADKSRLGPTERAQQLMNFVNELNRHPGVGQDLGKWNCQLENRLVQAPAKQLDKEKLFMSNANEQKIEFYYDQNKGSFANETRDKRFYNMPYQFNRWVLVVTTRTANQAKPFIDTLFRVARPMGIQLDQPIIKELNDDGPRSFAQFCKTIPQDIVMVVCIVPNAVQARYDAIKKVLCVENPIPSQVIVESTLKKNMMSVCTKIAIQMATKIGGEPWKVEIPLKQAMIIGYDTYHDKIAEKKSVGGFVASINDDYTNYYSKVNYHSAREEMSGNFTENVKAAIKHYHQRNRVFPKYIFIFRDGVGDGMFQHVYQYELAQIQKGIKELFQDQSLAPKLCFTIVSKRINTRFFARAGQNLANPPPGTVVDDVVTKSNRFDFFLISQSVGQGTVSPTNYNVIYSEIEFMKPFMMQKLAYKLTHLYFNWQGTLSVPAPCQYAHKLAYLTGVHLHCEPHPKLTDKLFYL